MKTEVKKITPAIAKELLQKNKRNRPVNQMTVSFYADIMARGQWELIWPI